MTALVTSSAFLTIQICDFFLLQWNILHFHSLYTPYLFSAPPASSSVIITLTPVCFSQRLLCWCIFLLTPLLCLQIQLLNSISFASHYSSSFWAGLPRMKIPRSNFYTLSLFDFILCAKELHCSTQSTNTIQSHYHPMELLPTLCPSSRFLHLSRAPFIPTALPLLSTNSSTLGLPLEADFLWLPVSSASHFK